MKKTAATIFTACLILLVMTACSPKEKAAAGSASPDDVLEYLPEDAQGVFFMDINRAMNTQVADKLIKDDENYQKYLEFVEKTGIDPQQDVFYVAAAMLPGAGPSQQQGVAIINLKYEKERILSMIEEEEKSKVITEDYSGVILHTWQEDQNEAMAFLDDSNIVAGNPDAIKACVDVIQNKKGNVFKNAALSDLLSGVDKSTLMWGAIVIPQEAKDMAAAENPQLEVLKTLTALTLNFDYKNQNIMAEIKAMGDDPAKNEQIVKMLDGFKAMGAMFAAEKPEVGELLNAITVSGSDEFVMISAEIPETLIDKLKANLPGQEKEEN